MARRYQPTTRAAIVRKFRWDNRRLIKQILAHEKRWGHHGVFAAIRDWLTSPLRGKFGWD